MKLAERTAWCGRLPVALVAALALGVVGCGAGKGPSAGAERAAAKPPGASSVPAAAAPKPGADLVTAVSAGKSPGIDLKFAITHRPEVGQPVDIEVALTPSEDYEQLQVIFRSTDGLAIRSGESMAVAEKPPAGVALHHTVSVVPKSDGIFSLTAVVLADSLAGSTSRTYSIPLIAGNGLPDTPAGHAVPPVAASSTP